MTTTTVATITRIVNITWTRAAKVRMTANVDMPEYGLKAQQVFYLVRSSADNNDYYLLVWDYAEVKWDCPCKHSVERPQARTCRHRRLVSADCRARKEAKKANALRLQQEIQEHLNNERMHQQAKAGAASIEQRMQVAGFMRR